METPAKILPSRIRQFVFVTLILVLFLPGALLMATILGEEGLSLLEILTFALFAILFLMLCFGNALALSGFFVRQKQSDPLSLHQRVPLNAGIERLPGTAIVIPIFNEDVGRVYQGIKTMFESLRSAGRLENFDFFILSDSNEPNSWVEEEKGWLELVMATAGFSKIFYRRRRVLLHNKSGNVADFCRRWGAKYRYMVVLDADSVMTGEALSRLVILMELHPRAGIIQTAPKMVLGKSLFRRIQQFSSQLYGPVFQAGGNFWHDDAGSFWGHNAIIRLQPFMKHCALAELPRWGALGGRILSHDTVEAALMRRAGYQVWVAEDIEGSYEEGPPNLIESLQRDRRWCQGNMQHLLVLFSPGLHWRSRFHILIGVLAYASAPLWLAFILLSFLQLMNIPFLHTNQGSILMAGISRTLPLFLYVCVLLFLPKILGLVELFGDSSRVKAFGGRLKILLGVLSEVIFSMLFAPIMMWYCTKFVFAALTGHTIQWTQQNRDASQEITWRNAFLTHRTEMAVGLLSLAALIRWQPVLVPWMLPVLAGLILSAPFSVLSSWSKLGEWTRNHGLFLIPEETNAPRELLAIERDRFEVAQVPFLVEKTYTENFGLLQVILDPYVHSIHLSLLKQKEGNEGVNEQNFRDCQELLELGPDAVPADEKVKLLWDVDSMVWLHRELWTRPASQLHQWWRRALNHYNDTTALIGRVQTSDLH